MSASLRVRNLRRAMARKRVPVKFTLEFQLCEILCGHTGERGDNEGAVDTLCRIIHERDRAMTLLALDRLHAQ